MQVTREGKDSASKSNNRRRIVSKEGLLDKIDGKKTFLDSPISVLGLGKRAVNGLDREGVKTVKDLVQKTEEEIMDINGFGQTSLFTVKWALAEKGLSIGTALGANELETGLSEGKKFLTEEERTQILNKTIAELGLSVRTETVLQLNDIGFVSQLVEMPEGQLLKMKNFGRFSLHEIKKKLEALGLELAKPGDESLSRTSQAQRGVSIKGTNLDGGQEGIMKKGVADLELSTRAINCLQSGGVNTVSSLVKETELSLSMLKGMGNATVKEIVQALSKLGLKLVDKPEKDSVLLLDIDRLGITYQASEFLEAAGIVKVNQLVEKSEGELLKIPGLNKVRLRGIKNALARFGLALARDEEDGQKHFISKGLLDTKKPSSSQKTAQKNPGEIDRYARMEDDELLDSAKIFIANEGISDFETFREKAPNLSEALVCRLSKELFFELGFEKPVDSDSNLPNDVKNESLNLSTIIQQARDEIKELRKVVSEGVIITTQDLLRLPHTAKGARKEVNALLKTVKPEKLQATLELLDRLERD